MKLNSNVNSRSRPRQIQVNLLLFRHQDWQSRIPGRDYRSRYLAKVFKSPNIDLVVMEACGPSGWIHDLVFSLGLKALVCSTNEDPWKWSNV